MQHPTITNTVPDIVTVSYTKVTKNRASSKQSSRNGIRIPYYSTTGRLEILKSYRALSEQVNMVLGFIFGSAQTYITVDMSETHEVVLYVKFGKVNLKNMEIFEDVRYYTEQHIVIHDQFNKWHAGPVLDKVMEILQCSFPETTFNLAVVSPNTIKGPYNENSLF